MSENSGPGEATDSGYYVNGQHEMGFYNRMSIPANYNKALPEEKTLYNILKGRVQIYGQGSLSTTSMAPSSVIGGGTKPILPYGTVGNPGIHKTLDEAERAMSFHNLREVAPGLYQEQSLQNGYVFVLSKPGKKTPTKTFVPPTNTPSFTPLPPPPVVKPPEWSYPKYKKPPKEVMKKVAQDYDLLFNSLEYTKTYQDEIDRLSMQLVELGDDLLTNYTYESIDFLPDVDIEVKTSTGEYKNAADVFSQTDQSQFLETVIDESEASDDIQLANKLVTYLESQISTSAELLTILKHYGSIKGSQFTAATPTENKVDFYIELSDEYDELDVEIRFDRL